MANFDEDRRTQARNKAQTHFTASDQRDDLIRKEAEKERSRNFAKMAKLKALRLAKAESAGEQPATTEPPARRRRPARPQVARILVK